MAQDPLKFLRERQGPTRAPLIKEPEQGGAPQRSAAPPNRPVPPSRQREFAAEQAAPVAEEPAAPSAPEVRPDPTPEPTPAPVQKSEPEGTGRLIVGPSIKMKGEIGACDTLIVQGEVEASMSGRVMEVAEGGVYRGKVELEEATVSGTVDGTLTVSGLLTIAKGGEVRGTVRYGELQIESGGVIAGDIGLVGDPAPEADKKTAKGEPQKEKEAEKEKAGH